MEQVVGGYCYAQSHHRQEPCPDSLVTCPLRKVLDTDRLVKLLHNHVREDGSKFHAEIVAAPLEIERNGRTQKHVVEAIRDLEKQINITQEQRLMELGQLAAGVAHEIHNPLASVRLGLQALMRKAKGESLDGAITDYFEQVEGEIDKCIEVTKRLLNLSIPPSENKQLVALSKTIPDVVSLLEFEAKQKHIDLQMDLDGELRVLATDSEMRMLVLNIVQNAFHAMPDGGRLDIRGRSANGQVRVEFADTGVGINNEVMDHIFDPFFSRRADQVVGTGLGLTICKAIVERHGGHIMVDSVPDSGAKFIVDFPCVDSGLHS